MHVMTACREADTPRPTPRHNGRMIELTDTLTATRSRPRICRRSSRYPTANMNITTPRVASALSAGLMVIGNSASVIFPSNKVGPNRMPAMISPITGGWPTRLAAMPNSRASRMMMARSTRKSWTHDPSSGAALQGQARS